MVQPSREKSLTQALKSVLVVLALAVAIATLASGQTPEDAAASTLVVAVVKIPIPSAIDHTKLLAALIKSIPEYQALPGLIRKYYIITDDQKFGGVYLWKDKASADAHYNDEWRAKILRVYGAPPDLTYFNVPIAIVGPAPQPIISGQTADTAAASTLVAAIVKLPIPAGFDNARLDAAMLKTVPSFQAMPGLVRKYYTITDDQKFGGVYLWQDKASADAHYNDEWRARMLKVYGAPADLTYFSVPIVIEGPAAQK
jgi:quinol monooxygenase YgiN